MTLREMVNNLEKRVSKLENTYVIGIDLNNNDKEKIEELKNSGNVLTAADRNEYDTISAVDSIFITVSPSNYTKLKTVKQGEMIRVFCTDNRTEGLVFTLCGITHDTVTYEMPKQQNTPKQKPKKSKKRRAKKSKKKNVQKKITQREQMIKSGMIVPANKTQSTKPTNNHYFEDKNDNKYNNYPIRNYNRSYE